MKNQLTVIDGKPDFALVPLKDAKAILVDALSTDKQAFVPKEKDLEILEAAVECQKSNVAAMLSYFDLCEKIHRLKPEPKVARAILAAAGIGKTRVSEILTVAFTSARLFAEYSSRAIGFKLALQKAREEKGPLPSLDTVPDAIAEFLRLELPALLGDKKKFVTEIAGVRLTVTKASVKPEQFSLPLEVAEVKPKKVASKKTTKKGK